MARINPLGRRSGTFLKRAHETLQYPLQSPPALPAHNERDVLLLRHHFLRFARLRHQAHDLERGKMLPGIRRLFQREGGFAFHDQSIKILTQKNRHRFGKRPPNLRFELVYLVENRERFILEDGICVKD